MVRGKGSTWRNKKTHLSDRLLSAGRKPGLRASRSRLCLGNANKRKESAGMGNATFWNLNLKRQNKNPLSIDEKLSKMHTEVVPMCPGHGFRDHITSCINQRNAPVGCNLSQKWHKKNPQTLSGWHRNKTITKKELVPRSSMHQRGQVLWGDTQPNHWLIARQKNACHKDKSNF